jgi:hypothetical protein
MGLNTWQRVELEKIFVSNNELNIIQQNILSMVLRMTDNSGRIENIIDEERGFSVSAAKDLNPHQGVEGIVLEAEKPLKQIRLQYLGFSARELYISENSIQVLDGKKLIEVVYKGGYEKERRGQIDVFAANVGKIATFDVIINNDFRLYLRK